VQVCPAGIDIRNGLQYACISCGLCIDACNQVMDKIGQPRGLIRFDTTERLEGKTAAPAVFWRPRVIAYASLLTLAAAGIMIGLAQRIPLRVDLLRERNALAREVEDGWIENVYTVKLMNMAETPRRFGFHVSGPNEARIVGPTVVDAPAGQVTSLVMAVRAKPREQDKHSLPLRLDAWAMDAPDTVHIQESTAFLRP
jgi:cytochrome c oxidase accessory protein FixG